MQSAYSLPDYRARFFEYKDLERIHGQPTINFIARLLRQVKCKAQTFSTTLGDEQLGYLTLVISLADYITIPNATIFRHPTDPGIFNIEAIGPVLRNEVALTTAEIATQKIAHNKLVRQYNEYQAAEMALRNHIISPIESNYFQPILNLHTDMINETIPEIVTFLRDTYGQLSSAQLKERERDIDNMVYNPATTIDSVFNKIQDFQDMCILLQNTKNGYAINHLCILSVSESRNFYDKFERLECKTPMFKNLRTS